jgi:cytoskeletal protein CcmA (bactofilin family)
MSWLGGKGKSKEPVTPVAKQSTTTGGGRMAQPAIESTIGANTHIKGDIQGDGGLRIDGVIEGTIEITGNLVITESAKVRAEIKANNVSIAGAVQGNVVANRVEIADTGRVWGDMTIKSLLINEGAYLRGQTFMSQDLQPPKLEPPKPIKSSSPLPGPQAGTVVDVTPEEKSK